MEEKIETKEPTIVEMDKAIAEGFRPTVVVCCMFNKTVLLLFKKDYRLWMLPQSGFTTDEDPKEVIKKELTEGLGKEFVKNCDKDYAYLGEDRVEFLPEKQTGEEITSSDGKSFKMIGKHYYFYAINVRTDEIDQEKTQYDEHYWLGYKGGLTLASKIYQSGKRRITMKAMELLKQKSLID